MLRVIQSSQRGMDRRIVAQLYDCFDQIRDIPRVENKALTSTTEVTKTEETEGEQKSVVSAEADTPNVTQTRGDVVATGGANTVQPFVIVIAATSR